MLFGTFRYLLSHLVVIHHISPGISAWSGYYAVFGFYVLSGYLMTYILNRTYGFKMNGLTSYALNRVVRIYPIYWVALIIGLSTILAYPSTAKALNKVLIIPRSYSEWIYNLSIFGLAGSIKGGACKVRMIPPAWALHIELIFYLLIPVIGRNKRRAFSWLALSLVYTSYILFTNRHFWARYMPAASASLPFSAGTTVYYVLHETTIGARIKRICNSKKYGLVLLPCLSMAFIFNLFFAGILGHPKNLPFYISLFISILLVAFLAGIDHKKIPKALRRIDKFLGDLSYPIYLIHYQIAILMIVLLWKGVTPSRISDQREILLLVTVVTTNAAAVILHMIVEKNTSRIRDKIRGVRIDL